MGRAYFDSPIGTLEIVEENGLLSRIAHVNEHGAEEPSPLTLEVKRQLGGYFDGSLKEFDLPVKMPGTGFWGRVWECMSRIPYGQTVTYGELARWAGSKGACRSVGSCAHNNPIMIVIPCHRVVAAHGLGGFGIGLDAKRFLLELERKNSE